jgi:hypothetical protein
MQDFIKIGGEIVSSPLNENFRKLANSISISNVNLIFSEEHGIVNTISDMEKIQNPENGQACYVVSSGELYRYNRKDHQWYKIADFGRTFRQGFLNSGAVVLEDYVKIKEGSNATLLMPNMLVYFKNQDGDERYLRGMYLIPAKEVDFSDKINAAMAYSILVDRYGEYDIISGLPSEDNPNKVFIGSFLTNSSKKIIRDFVYTLPDMAYTADRGNFLINGGQASGLTLYAHTDGGKKVSRKSGFYYDEGINFSIGQTKNFPADNENGSNYDLKSFGAEELVDELIYLTPSNSLENDIIITPELIINKYWNGNALVDVPEGMATIQHHLVTPNGQNIILYGNKYYNSFTDAAMNLNYTEALDLNFPFVEATRIVVVNTPGFTTNSDRLCNFYALTKLAQVGTISPVFSDAAFELYSGDGRDNSPSRLSFSLNELQKDEFGGLFTAVLPKYRADRFNYALDYKFISNTLEEPTEKVSPETENLVREYISNPGFVIGDAADIQDIHKRVSAIEREIWESKRKDEEIYNQSIRYRLDDTEIKVSDNINDINTNKTNIENLFKQKVDKATVINEYVLGEENDVAARTITLRTGDIEEGYKQNNPETGIKYEWYSNAKVSKHPEVKAAYEHSLDKSEDNNANPHIVVNPHNLSTDDLRVLSDTDRMFLTRGEKERIDLKKLPADTWKEIKDLQAKDTELDEKKIEYVKISTFNKDDSTITPIADVKELRFITNGAKVTSDANGDITTIECIGQRDGLMQQIDYATKEQLYPQEIVEARNAIEGGKYTNVFTFGPENQIMVDLTQYRLLTDAEKTEVDYIKNEYSRLYRTHNIFNGEHFVDNALNARYASIIKGLDEYSSANQYYGTNEDNIVGVYDLPIYVSTEEGSHYDNVTDVILTPDEGSVNENSLTEDLRNKINNNYHTVLHNGEEKSAAINKFRFGDNLTVDVDPNDSHMIVINSTGAGGSEVRNFINLTDVSVSYPGNAGKILVVNGAETGVTLANAPAFDQFMERAIYVNPQNIFQVRSAQEADYAASSGYADNADLAAKANNAFALDSVTIDNTKTTNYLWTASQIISNTSSQIEAEGVKVHHGTTAPSNDLGKDGDIYILIEE